MSRPSWFPRFWAKVNKTATCWLWTSHCDPLGYARFWFEGRSALAHVVIWTHHNGSVPDGLEVLHECDTRKCVRLSCLSTGTHTKNMQDAARRDRITSRRLSEADAINILTRHRAGETPTAIARVLDVSFWNVRDVLRGRTFRWLVRER